MFRCVIILCIAGSIVIFRAQYIYTCIFAYNRKLKKVDFFFYEGIMGSWS